ncbi:NAD(P)-binding protein [Aspergillus sclerotiicarbonarius CBS 121057]|uniref:NAD(P)-binding protein n=1 Tax=Aspergillus sclerotiicarbonarius (strain CBS 121057 / IBT 28362) TaxID=1448318 RepID=A0A319EN96_ASPSB|nr:NAD(P)-binding protein [Aspergillus sclerotiicarbonarius CBS 121057]
MVSLPEIRASNARITSTTAPHVSIFTGATDGIGKATLTRLISTNLPMKVYIIGRNSEKHQPFLSKLRESNNQADIIWLEGQLSLLADTKRLCDEVKARETSIDCLYMSAGFIASGERVETSEGLCLAQSLTYYSRMMLITHLLPLLNASTNNPRIISILAAGNESTSIYLDDLDLKQPGRFGLVPLSRAAATYTTLSMSRLAEENPGVVFIHHYPGGVDTGLFKKAWGEKWYWPLFGPVLATFGTSPEEAAEKVLFLMTSAKYGGKGVELGMGLREGVNMKKGKQAGALFLVNDKVKELQQDKVMMQLREMDAGDIVWRKTVETIQPYS